MSGRRGLVVAARLALTPALLAAPLAACASATTVAPSSPSRAAPSLSPPPTKADASLYERLGGKPAIEAVVDRFLGHVASDARIAHRFALSDISAVRRALVEQICAATGGPCTYGGDMKAVHRGQRVTNADFDALVQDLQQALADLQVPAREQGELLAALAPMRAAIVEDADDAR